MLTWSWPIISISWPRLYNVVAHISITLCSLKLSTLHFILSWRIYFFTSFVRHNLKLSRATVESVSCKSICEHKSLSHGRSRASKHNAAPPSPSVIVNGSTSRRASLALCVYCLHAQLCADWLHSAKRQDNVCFCCLPGEVPLVPSQAPATVTDTKFRGCQAASSWCGAASSCGCTPKLVRNCEWVIYLCFYLFHLFYSQRGLQ